MTENADLVSQDSGLIRNRRYALLAAIWTGSVAISGLRAALSPAPYHERWLFMLRGLPHLRPLLIGLSVFYWLLVLWVFFWFYQAARGKYEHFLVGSFALAFVLGVIEGFLPSFAATNVGIVSIAASILSFMTAMALVFKTTQRA
jgi:hypothetical protein